MNIDLRKEQPAIYEIQVSDDEVRKYDPWQFAEIVSQGGGGSTVYTSVLKALDESEIDRPAGKDPLTVSRHVAMTIQISVNEFLDSLPVTKRVTKFNERTSTAK